MSETTATIRVTDPTRTGEMIEADLDKLSAAVGQTLDGELPFPQLVLPEVAEEVDE